MPTKLTAQDKLALLLTLHSDDYTPEFVAEQFKKYVDLIEGTDDTPDTEVGGSVVETPESTKRYWHIVGSYSYDEGDEDNTDSVDYPEEEKSEDPIFTKYRLANILVDNGLADDEEQAYDLIGASRVRVADNLVTNPHYPIANEDIAENGKVEVRVDYSGSFYRGDNALIVVSKIPMYGAPVYNEDASYDEDEDDIELVIRFPYSAKLSVGEILNQSGALPFSQQSGSDRIVVNGVSCNYGTTVYNTISDYLGEVIIYVNEEPFYINIA